MWSTRSLVKIHNIHILIYYYFQILLLVYKSCANVVYFNQKTHAWLKYNPSHKTFLKQVLFALVYSGLAYGA